MPITLGDVIRSARDLHPSFKPQQTPDPVLMRWLSDYQEELRGRLLDWNPDAITATETIALPLADFSAGHTLPEYQRIREADIRYGTGASQERMDLPIAGPRFRHELLAPIAYVEGGVLYLVGKEKDYNGFDQIRVRYVPAPTDLTDATSAFSLPDRARPVLKAWAAAFMASRGPLAGDAPPDKVELTGKAEKAEETFLTELERRDGPVVSRVRRVW